MSIKLETINCDLCGSNNNALLLQTRDYRYGNPDMFNIVKCKECGLIYLNPRPTAESVLEQYKEDYTPDEKMNNLRRSRGVLKKIFGRFWYKIGGSYGVSEIKVKGRFLDIGCAQGDTIEAARGMGADVYGIELNPKSVKVCKDKSLNVHCGTVEDSAYPDDYFDIIWMSQVIEHLPSPKSSLKEIRRILKPGDGRLYIFCPNAGSYLANFFGKYWHGWHIPFHFYAYTRETITKLVAECGFKVEKLSATTPYNFFSVSLKSMLSGKTKEPMKRVKLIDSLLFGASISLIFRILDLCLSGKGDCLKVVLIKE